MATAPATTATTSAMATAVSRRRSRVAVRLAASDLGVAGASPGLDERPLQVGHRATLHVERLDRRPPAERLGRARRRVVRSRPRPVPRPRGAAAGQPATVLVDPADEPRPASQQRLVGHLDGRLTGRRVAVGDEQPGGDELVGDAAHPRRRARRAAPAGGCRAKPCPGATRRANSSRACTGSLEAGVHLLGAAADGAGHAADAVQRVAADDARRRAGRTARSA